MYFEQFADAMIRLGFQNDESIRPTFQLDEQDLADPVFKNAYPKVAGSYRVISFWGEGEEPLFEVALWAKEERSATKLFPFFKAEVDWLAAKKKFRKG